jgi:hypothetical protein
MKAPFLISIVGLIAAAAPQPATAQTLVPVPAFDQIELRGGGEVIVRHGPVQRVTLIEGDPRISLIEVERRGGDNDRLRISPCEQRCPQRYRLKVEIVTPRLPAVSITGGGSIVAHRFPAQRNVAAAVTGGGSLDLRAVPARAVAAAVTGGGNLLVSPQASLVAAVRGGGRIRYWGNPSVTQAVHGGGVVTRGN